MTGSPWYTVSTPALVREVLLTRERDFSTRFVPPMVSPGNAIGRRAEADGRHGTWDMGLWGWSVALQLGQE